MIDITSEILLESTKAQGPTSVAQKLKNQMRLDKIFDSILLVQVNNAFDTTITEPRLKDPRYRQNKMFHKYLYLCTYELASTVNTHSVN